MRQAEGMPTTRTTYNCRLRDGDEYVRRRGELKEKAGPDEIVDDNSGEGTVKLPEPASANNVSITQVFGVLVGPARIQVLLNGGHNFGDGCPWCPIARPLNAAQ